MKTNAEIGALCLAACLALFGMGCGPSAQLTRTGSDYPPWQGAVKIFESIPDSVKYIEIGWVSAKGEEDDQAAEMLVVMQKKAAHHGANAIVLVSQKSDQVSSAVYTPQMGLISNTGSVNHMVARAVRILDIVEDKQQPSTTPSGSNHIR